MNATLTLGGLSQLVETREYVPGTNLPEVGSRLVVSVIWNDQKKQWEYVERKRDGMTIFVWDKTQATEPKIDDERWTVTITRIIVDSRSTGNDPSQYYRVIVVQPVAPYVSNKEMKRRAKAGNQVSIVSQVETPKVIAQPNRRLDGICFQRTGDNWTFSFTHTDGVELFVIEDAPKELVAHKYRHIAGKYSVPLNVEVVKTITDDPKFKKFAVRVLTDQAASK